MAGAVTLLERLVAANGTVLGTFTIADCCAAPVLYRTANTKMDLTPYPKLGRIREAVVCARRLHGRGSRALTLRCARTPARRRRR